MVSNTRKFIGVLLITATMVTGTLIYSANQEEPSDGNEKPPTFNIEISRSRLIGQLNGDSCGIPGYTFTTDDAADFDDPAGVPDSQKYLLGAGVHIYHADTAMTMAEVKSMIVPEPDNKIMIVHYNPVNNAEHKFSLYPALNSDKVISINNPAAYTIPANNGIIIVSCNESHIWKVKPETMVGSGPAGNLAQVTDNWVLVAASNNLDLDAYNVTAVHPQNGPGFGRDTFAEGVDPNGEIALSNFYMLWLRISPEEAENGRVDTPAADPDPAAEPDPAEPDPAEPDPGPTPVNLSCRTKSTNFANDEDLVETGTFEALSTEFEAMRVGNWQWHWDFGDGTTSSEDSVPVVHTFARAGTYDVTVRVTAPDGRTGSASCSDVAIEQRAPQPLNLSCTVNSIGYADLEDSAQTANFTASSTEDASYFTAGEFDMTWNFGDGTPAISDTSPPATHTYSALGTYRVTVNLTTRSGRTGSAVCENVVVAGAPSFSEAFIDAACDYDINGDFSLLDDKRNPAFQAKILEKLALIGVHVERYDDVSDLPDYKDDDSVFMNLVSRVNECHPGFQDYIFGDEKTEDPYADFSAVTDNTQARSAIGLQLGTVVNQYNRARTEIIVKYKVLPGWKWGVIWSFLGAGSPEEPWSGTDERVIDLLNDPANYGFGKQFKVEGKNYDSLGIKGGDDDDGNAAQGFGDGQAEVPAGSKVR